MKTFNPINKQPTTATRSPWLGSIAVALAIGLGGCAAKTPTLYNWQGYQKNVDAYLRGDPSNVSEQTKNMEQDLQKIRAANGVVPPGYNAHLGLLYAKQGNLAGFSNQLNAEKTQYP